MSDIAILVENLGKRYRIGKALDHADGWRSLLRRASAPFRYLSSTLREPNADEIIWALKEISFEIKRGEVVGIIGRNGAGKTTLLKILSRITEPTEGRAVVNGRVGSLLEVGTGFHPELTGRENIYLSGAIMGMKRSETRRKFDEIVAFSGVEKFIDTPVKRFSSGMFVRLAFAVAAHLEPEILLVDEVLAVGDAAFQRKCLGRMSEVANEGRTVLYVSHNMASIENLCSKAFLLEHGRILRAGETSDITEAYIRSLQSLNNREFCQVEDREGNGYLRFTDLIIRDSYNQAINFLSCGQNVTFELAYKADVSITSKNVVMSVAFFNMLGQPLFLCRSDLQGTEYAGIPPEGSVFCNIPRLPLPPGEFRINLHCEVNGELADWIRDARIISVEEGDFYGSGRLPPRKRGDLLIEHKWLQPIKAESELSS